MYGILRKLKSILNGLNDEELEEFDLELENEKLKKTDLKQAKIECLEVSNKKLQKENEQLRTEVNSLKAENEELKILKSGIQTLQDLRIEDGKYIVMSKNDFLNGSCKHLLDDYISKQEIKNIIDKIDYDIKKTNEIIENGGISSYQVFMLSKINTKSSNIKERLQKLLESEE